MKKVVSLIVAVILVLSFGSFAFADSEEPMSENIQSKLMINCPVIPAVRGANLPTQTVQLYSGVTYTGNCDYYVAVYTNYLFSNHDGSIRIYVSNTYENSNDYGRVMTVSLCHKDIWGLEVVDDTRDVGVNDNATLMFTGLNTNKSYFFKFSQSNQSYCTYTYFEITRGN